jgi:predicted dehydrogenase
MRPATTAQIGSIGMGREYSRGRVAAGAPTVAVLGQGSIGRRHAGLLAAAGCAVTAWDPVVDTGVESAQAALDGADAVVVASPTSEHLAQARLALEAGCHVLVEKPLSTTAAGLDGLVALAAARERVLAVGFNLRFHPGPARVRAAVRAGEVGRPLLAHLTFGSWLPGWRPGTDYRTSYSARAALGGGVLLDVTHELDLAAWILGEVAEVGAWLGRVSDLEIDVEDTALLTCVHREGTVSTIALDYLDRDYRRGCRLVGSEGSVEWRWGPDFDVQDAYRAQTAAFLEAVRDGGIPEGSPLCDGTAGAHAVAICDAARASHADGGRRVAL